LFATSASAIQASYFSEDTVHQMSNSLIIVGGSYAAYQTAASARENGRDGSIAIITDEAELPYHRPPLSKAFLQEGPEKQELPLLPIPW
jgi:hypothetical protein